MKSESHIQREKRAPGESKKRATERRTQNPGYSVLFVWLFILSPSPPPPLPLSFSFSMYGTLCVYEWRKRLQWIFQRQPTHTAFQSNAELSLKRTRVCSVPLDLNKSIEVFPFFSPVVVYLVFHSVDIVDNRTSLFDFPIISFVFCICLCGRETSLAFVAQ